MPYIECNGVTRSRYSQEPEVKECIAEEREAHDACMQSTECRANKEITSDVYMDIGVAIFLLLLVLIVTVSNAMRD